MEIQTKSRVRDWTFPAKYRMGSDYYPMTVSVSGQQITKSPVTERKQVLEYIDYLKSVGRGTVKDPYYKQLLGWDYGGPFYSYSCTYKQSDPWYPKEGLVANSIVPLYFEGTPVPMSLSHGVNGQQWLPESWFTNELQLALGLGTTAIARCEPTNPVSNVSTFLGELTRDGLPQASSELLKNRIKSFKDLGSDYLNVEFAWKPFVSDIRKFLVAIRDSHKILDQYERDSGKVVRRKYRFPEIKTVQAPGVLNGNKPAEPPMVPQFWDSQWAPLMEYDTYIKNYWFSGAFTYYLTRGDSTFSKMERWAQEADKLLGIKITPDVLWNLAPWSWFADWIFNFGDVLHNVTAFSSDKLTMRYGYIMADLSYTRRIYMDGVRFSDHKPRDRIWQDFTTRVKSRQKATPYGFGLNPSTDFTSRQWAILGALGMTQGPGILKSM